MVFIQDEALGDIVTFHALAGALSGKQGRFLHVPQRRKGHQEASPQYRAGSRDECM